MQKIIGLSFLFSFSFSLISFLSYADKDEEVLFFEDGSGVERWKTLSGGKIKVSEFLPRIKHTPVFKLRNSIHVVPLKTVLTGGFSISAKLRQTHYKRALFVGLANDDLTDVIGFLWDSSLDTAFEGKGFLVISSYKNDGIPFDFNRPLKRLTKPVSSPQLVKSKTFIRCELVYLKKQKKLILLANNKKIAEIESIVLKDYTKIIIKSGAFGYFDSIKLTV